MLYVFNNSVKEMAEYMKKSVAVNKNRKSHDWFDFECSIDIRNVRKQIRKEHSGEELHQGVTNASAMCCFHTFISLKTESCL